MSGPLGLFGGNFDRLKPVPPGSGSGADDRLKPVPLLLLCTDLARGGAETQVALLARELRARGWAVHVASLVEPSAFWEELKAAGIPVHSLGMTPGRADARGLFRLLSILRRVRPAVLHCHLFHANILGRLARLAVPVPRVISTLHSLAESGRSKPDVRWRDRAYRLTDRLSNCTSAVCAAVAERHVAARAVRREKVHIVPNGVDTDQFRPDPARRDAVRAALGAGVEFVRLAAGRLMWKKDYPTMLRAMARQPAGVLWIAGEGPLEAELQAQARESGVRVRFLGERADLPELMNAADALVLSSVVEGLPMVLLEAAASGLPCVTTRAGGAAEAVENGRTGFVTESGDAEALAAAMGRLAGMGAEARFEMGRAARALALERFDLRAVVARWEAIYRER
jgi:glycosyltransferase involved in cell wall biosynthesis